jgi:hypothetical protein
MFVQEVTLRRKRKIYSLFEVYVLPLVLRRELDVSEEVTASIFKESKSKTSKEVAQSNGQIQISLDIFPNYMALEPIR